MAITKRIVCLANSRKLNGRCIAGRELVSGSPGAWIRPVSRRSSEEVLKFERQYPDGSDPNLLDVVEVPMSEHLPKDHQQENWLIAPKGRWKKVGNIFWDDLEPFSESGGTLWQNGHQTRNGVNNRIPDSLAEGETSSLKLIHVDEVCLDVFAPSEDFGDPTKRVQAKFHFCGFYYSLSVTDPDIEEIYRRREEGYYKLSECYLTISLAEPYHGYCYKLVAAIIEKP